MSLGLQIARVIKKEKMRKWDTCDRNRQAFSASG